MASSVPEFWQLVEQSRLLAGDQCQQLHQEFNNTNGSTDHASPRALGEWLVSRNIFSRYQVTVLLAGRPGPFVYGDYKIYDRVEAGRLANEFRAVHATAGHPVLLKFLTGALVQDSRLWNAAASEAQIACSLSHPNLQRFFELVDLGSFKFLVEEDLHGETLGERLAAGRLPPHEACRVARLLAQGLAAIHATGRAHGDVRPLNVWLEPASPQHPEGVKLLRDPLAAPAPPNFSADDPHGWLLAQSDYLAPEFQMQGKAPGVLTDLYALGCTLYHMLAGHPPFPGGSAVQKMSRHASEAIRPLESYGVPQPMAQLVTFLMAKNATLRYQDAKAVVDQLGAFVDPGLIHVSPPPASPTLSAFEAAVRQSQARLAARTVQSTFGLAAPAVTSHEEAAAPAIRTAQAPAVRATETPIIRTENPVEAPKGNIPVGSVPKGKSVAPASAPVAGVAVRPTNEKIVDTAKALDPAQLAAKEARERKKLITILVGVGVAAIALIIGVNMLGRGKPDDQANSTEPDPEVVVPEIIEDDRTSSSKSEKAIKLPENFTPTVEPVKSKKPPKEKAPEAGLTFDVVPDDGKLPWASPTTGKPLDLKYVPPLAGVFVAVRPADLLATSEGPKVLKALGPKFAAVQADFEKISSLKFADCQQLLVSLHDNNSAFPKVSIVARLKDAIDPAELAVATGATAQKTDAAEFYAQGTQGYYLPAEENGTVLVMAEVEDLKEVIKEPLLPRKRELEQVRRNTDADRHVTVLFDPTFVFSGEGDPLFAGDFARAKEPLRWLLGEGLQVGALSMHFSDAFYWELRVQSKVDKVPQDLAADFRKRMEEVPSNLEDYFAGPLDAPQYWKKLANRLPGMARQLHEETRVAAEGNQAVVNSILPTPAAHNLILGAELAIATAPGASTTVAAAPTANLPKTLEEVLNLKMKQFSFDQTTFETAIQDIEKEAKDLSKGSNVDFSFVILGDDLKTEGLTRNKSLSNFKMEDKPISEVLTGICMANNNVPGVKSPSEANQKLVWAIAADAPGARKVFITTRVGAAAHGYKLPAVFETK